MILFPDYKPLINELSEVVDILDKARDADWKIADLHLLTELTDLSELLYRRGSRILNRYDNSPYPLF